MSQVSLLTRKEVELRTGLSRSAIYARITAGTFPAPRKAPDCASVRWVSTEIDTWIEQWIASSTAAGTMVGSKPKEKKKPLKSAA